jgi:5-methylcytosine-specific restriction protein A
MAMAPPRPCGNPRCGKLNCTEHLVESWRTRDRPTVTRIRGRELQRRRGRLFARQPWCVKCLPDGRHTKPTIRDHIIPLAEGGTEDESNEQALCLDCSDRKTEGESLRGIRASSLTPRFRKSSTPRDQTGQFRTRRR